MGAQDSDDNEAPGHAEEGSSEQAAQEIQAIMDRQEAEEEVEDDEAIEMGSKDIRRHIEDEEQEDVYGEEL